MAKEVTVFQKGDVRVVNIPGSESFYVEEWIEEDGEWIEHIEFGNIPAFPIIKVAA